MTATPRLTDSLDQARGPMLAAAIGDALGWPIENRSGRVGGISRVEPRLELTNWVRREGGRYAPHEVAIEAGSYSDDTQLTLAIARSRLRGADWWSHWTDCELPLWLLYERGGGGASKRAAQAWNRGRSPWSSEAKPADIQKYFSAGGNGVAMRVMPHVLIDLAESFDPIATAIVADGLCTHGHPRALVGALAYGYALWVALHERGVLGFGELVERTLEDEDRWGRFPSLPAQLDDWQRQAEVAQPRYPQVWEGTLKEMRALLGICKDSLGRGSLAVDQKTLEEIGAFDKQTNGAGTIAAAASLFLASRYAPEPRVGLTAAAFAKGADTDTIAAMTGGLLGAIDSDGWFSTLSATLQDASYIERLTGRLVQTGATPWSPEPSWRQADRRRALEQLQASGGRGVIELPVFGSCEIAREQELTTKSTNRVLEWTLSTSEGQTLHPKRVIPDDSGRSGAERTPGQQTPKAPFWMVRRVADLKAAKRFYESTLGLTVSGSGDPGRAYVLDRVVLELAAPDQPSPTLTDESALLSHGEALMVFRSAPEFKRLHANLVSAESHVSTIFQQNGQLAFRCTDPDGYVTEVRVSPNGG